MIDDLICSSSLRSNLGVVPFPSSIIPATPEAVLCREDSKRGYKLLEKESMRRHYAKILEISSHVANVYLTSIPQATLDKINKIKIMPQKRSFLHGRYMEISFERIKE